jgi:hypothetical protein
MAARANPSGIMELPMQSQHVFMAAIAVIVVCGSTPPSHADLYRCQRPDGSVVYTDDQTLCPGAEAHEPQGVIQHVPKRSNAKGQAPAKRLAKMRRMLEADAAGAAAWAKKKADAEQELAKLTSDREEMKRYVSHCSRGGTIFRTKENGLKEGVSCRQVRAEFASLEKRHAEIAAYLDGGLQEECHRAGCLPGWVR